MKIKSFKKLILMTAITAFFLAVGVQFSSSALAFNLPAQVVAESQQSLNVTGEVKGFVVRNGEKIPATSVQPGEVIIWDLTLHNSASYAVKNIKFDGDIPEGTVYLKDSAAGVEFSLDGKEFSRNPMVRDANGNLVAAPVSAYRAVRFTVSLNPNETKTVTYKTTVK